MCIHSFTLRPVFANMQIGNTRSDLCYRASFLYHTQKRGLTQQGVLNKTPWTQPKQTHLALHGFVYNKYGTKYIIPVRAFEPGILLEVTWTNFSLGYPEIHFSISRLQFTGTQLQLSIPNVGVFHFTLSSRNLDKIIIQLFLYYKIF